ncbi:MAG: hypothetical protein E6R03_13445 [Hyphomicrobiaceae bacterium]|nr:MAG: hypothetical protein E6R03_13445 [Hyphomicrobiaceae bacterium]
MVNPFFLFVRGGRLSDLDPMNFSSALTYKKLAVNPLSKLAVGDSFIDAASAEGVSVVLYVVTNIQPDGMYNVFGLTTAANSPGWLPYTLGPSHEVVKVVGIDATLELEVA